MQPIPVNAGAMGWEKLKLEHEPKSGGRFAAMFMGMLKPEWDELLSKQGAPRWGQMWREWENSVMQYEAQSGEKISSSTKIANIYRWFPDLFHLAKTTSGDVYSD